jgi:hypothetical protein
LAVKHESERFLFYPWLTTCAMPMIADQFFRLARTLRHNPNALKRIPAKLANAAQGLAGYARDSQQSTYKSKSHSAKSIIPILGALLTPPGQEHSSRILAVAQRYLEHRFNLLGSGWVEIRHGMHCRGVGGTTYAPGPRVRCDWTGDWLAGRINSANLSRSQAIWQLTQGPYRPIDWQLDFRSGYRWSEKTWHLYVPHGHRRGVDIKLPWELARMQHLPQLAHAWAIARSSPSSPGAEEHYLREYCNQIIDFMACNPPRWGVNWAGCMDVAIRAVNWLFSFDLFRAYGAGFPAEFEPVLARSIQEHAEHIAANLDWHQGLRCNHYLAEIVGLLFCAAYLPASAQQRKWLAFAQQGLIREVAHQFLDDGGGFESSTCYHRLSAEMVLYGTALVLGLPEDKRSALAASCPQASPDDPQSLFPPEYFARLRRIGEFGRAVLNPLGRLFQIGDNDSGRLLKLMPTYLQPEADLQEDLLDGGHLPAAFVGLGLLDSNGVSRFEHKWERDLVAALGGPAQVPKPEAPVLNSDVAGLDQIDAWEKALELANSASVTYRLDFPDPQRILQDLELHVFPLFGLYLFRSAGLYLCIRCGPFNHDNTGAHAHLDQLSLELWLDGKPLIQDPGSAFYTSFPIARDAYRGAAAHFVPVPKKGGEPGDFSLGVFRLPDKCGGVCHYCGQQGFWGSHQGYGFRINRVVELSVRGLFIYDESEPAGLLRQRGPADLSQGWRAETAPFTAGYGICQRANHLTS